MHPTALSPTLIREYELSQNIVRHQRLGHPEPPHDLVFPPSSWGTMARRENAIHRAKKAKIMRQVLERHHRDLSDRPKRGMST